MIFYFNHSDFHLSKCVCCESEINFLYKSLEVTTLGKGSKMSMLGMVEVGPGFLQHGWIQVVAKVADKTFRIEFSSLIIEIRQLFLS